MGKRSNSLKSHPDPTLWVSSDDPSVSRSDCRRNSSSRSLLYQDERMEARYRLMRGQPWDYGCIVARYDPIKWSSTAFDTQQIDKTKPIFIVPSQYDGG